MAAALSVDDEQPVVFVQQADLPLAFRAGIVGGDQPFVGPLLGQQLFFDLARVGGLEQDGVQKGQRPEQVVDGEIAIVLDRKSVV